MAGLSFYTFTIVSLLLANHLALGQNWPKVVFNGGLVEDNAKNDFHKIVLECFVSAELPVNKFQSSSEDGESVSQAVGSVYYNYSRFELLLNGSRLKSSPPVLVNYSSSMVGETKLSASFYLPKGDSFYGQFECSFFSLQLNSSATLLLIYKSHGRGHNLLLTALAATFLGLFLISLLLVFSTCLAARKRIRSGGVTNVECYPEETSSWIKHKKDKKSSLFQHSEAATNADHLKSYSYSCSSQEEANNAILEYLSHQTPCPEDGCPCYQYKEELQGCRLKSDKHAKKTRVSSWTSTNWESSKTESVSKDGVLNKRHTVPDSEYPSLNFADSLLKLSDHTSIYPATLPCCSRSLSSANEDSSFFVGPPDVFEVGSSGGSYSNEDHQVYLKVPEGAVPRGNVIHIKIGVGLISSKASCLPPNSKLVSPIASFHVEGEKNFHFLRPVEITLPHFVDLKDEDDVKDTNLTFLKASCHLHCFHKAKGSAEFKPKSQTATLKTKHFCSFCIAANKSLKSEKIHYRLVKVIPRLNHQMDRWRASFCVTYYLRTCLEVKITKLRKIVQNLYEIYYNTMNVHFL